jgi:hypothetical protein
MKNFGAKWLALAVVFGAAAGLTLNGCGDSGGNNAKGGSGGSGGKGGTTGTAGHGGTTGTAGTGGGTAGTGGSSAGHGGTTGTAGAGGTSATGTAGAGGGTGGSGAGGTGGHGGGSGLNCPVATFDTALEGFGLNQYNTNPGNLFTREAGAKASFAFESSMGDPAAGSVKIDAPYDAYDQLVDLQKGWSATTLQNWTGATKLHVRVKVASGLNPTSAGITGGVQPYVQTTSGYVDCRAWNNIPSGKTDWGDYVLDLSTCMSSWKIDQVIAVGVTVETGSGLVGDAGVNPQKPTTAVIYVDSFWLEGTCTGGAGGAGGATGGSGGAAGHGGAGGATGGSGGATGGSGGAAGHGGAGGATGGSGGATGGGGGATGGAGGATGGGTGGAGGSTGGAGGAGGGTGGATGGAGGAAGTAGAAGSTAGGGGGGAGGSA